MTKNVGSHIAGQCITQTKLMLKQRHQRKKWVQNKKQEAFKILCTHISESLETHEEVYPLRGMLPEYEHIQRDMMLTNEEIRNTCDDRQVLYAPSATNVIMTLGKK